MKTKVKPTISLRQSCYCMTKTIEGRCGKCKKDKTNPPTETVSEGPRQNVATPSEPTVEGLDRLIDELWSIKFQSMNKDEFDNEVRTLISLFQSHSVQEAKEEGAREILRDIDNLQISCAKADGVIDGITALHQLRVGLLASLKQEEEHD